MDPISSALSQQRILLENSLATVASECVVVRHENGSRSILALSQITGMSTIRLTQPGLLVLAAAALLIAAAAHFSKEGGSAEFPIAILAFLLVGGFFLSRRGAVYFKSDDGGIQTAFGTLTEAAAVIAAVNKALDRREEQEEDAGTESLAF